jgi:hypothetical protein
MSIAMFSCPCLRSSDDAFYDAAQDLDSAALSWDEEAVALRIQAHIMRHRASFQTEEAYIRLYEEFYRSDYRGWVNALRARQELLAQGPGCEVVSLSAFRSASRAAA